MARSTKQAWLDGPGDLREDDVEDVPVEGQSVRVRGLPAAYSNRATSEAMEMTTGARGEQVAHFSTGRLAVLQFKHGVIEPEFTLEEVEAIAEKYGPAFNKVVARIDELSGVDKEAIEAAEARFHRKSARQNGSEVGTPTPAGSS